MKVGGLGGVERGWGVNEVKLLGCTGVEWEGWDCGIDGWWEPKEGEVGGVELGVVGLWK